MSRDQQTAIQEIKSAAGWINGYTLPDGYVLDDKGYATLSTSLIYEVQRQMSQTTISTAVHPMVPLTPPPSYKPPTPPRINTNPGQTGAAFGRRGSRTP